MIEIAPENVPFFTESFKRITRKDFSAAATPHELQGGAQNQMVMVDLGPGGGKVFCTKAYLDTASEFFPDQFVMR
ncbi:MAG: hypothetical protein CMF48_06605 [Legionellales bacterium]|nr:hypothetical protein [Legionellales bacterium]|tara:strand:- start:4605 stop:4829 length:225 start_codon:yes stop_codon:yes gene_type:complete